MKRLVATMVALLISLMAVNPASAQENPAGPNIRVVMDGKDLTFDESPFVEGGRTLVPLRALAENLGFTVAYDAADQKITLAKGDNTLVLWVDQRKVIVNGVESTIDVSPKVRAGRSFVPVRFVAERLGAAVGWNAEQQSVTVSAGGARQLLEQVSKAQSGWPPADQKMSSALLLKTQMGIAGQSMTFEMPMEINLNIYQGDMLSTYTIRMPAMLNRPPVVMQMALKSGKLYMTDPATGGWALMGEMNPLQLADFTNNPDLKNFVNPMGLQDTMLKEALVTYGPTEEIDGVTTSRIDVALSPKSLTGVFDQLLSSLAGVGGNQAGMKMSIDHYKMSHWINPKTGLVHKTTMDMSVNLTVTEGGQSQSMQMTMAGTLQYQYVSEPIQFPDLSGAKPAAPSQP